MTQDKYYQLHVHEDLVPCLFGYQGSKKLHYNVIQGTHVDDRLFHASHNRMKRVWIFYFVSKVYGDAVSEGATLEDCPVRLLEFEAVK